MKIEQTAGRCGVSVHTDGEPLWPTITVGSRGIQTASMQDLHDLRYCIDRVLAQLPAERRG